MVERRLAEPLIVMDAVEQILLSLSEELFRCLQQRVEGAREVEASFFRADGNVRRISIQTGRPITGTKTLLRLLKERLSTLSDPLDAGYGFDILRLAAVRTERSQAIQKVSTTGRRKQKKSTPLSTGYPYGLATPVFFALFLSTRTFPNAPFRLNPL